MKLTVKRAAENMVSFNLFSYLRLIADLLGCDKFELLMFVCLFFLPFHGETAEGPFSTNTQIINCLQHNQKTNFVKHMHAFEHTFRLRTQQ